MKAFKKLMAAALVCVMALTMLTGCAVSDNLVEKALVNKLNAVSAVSYKHKTDLDDEAKKAWDAKRTERFYAFTKEIFIMNGLVALGAGIAALTGIGGGIGIGIATGKATEAISRQPEASNKIQTNLLLGAALAEGTAIFGFVVALIIILFLG